MRLVHFAYLLTAALLAVTSYLAWEGQQAARGAKEELDFVKKKQAAKEAATPVTSAFSPSPTVAPVASITPPVPGVLAAPAKAPNPALAESTASELPGGGLTIPKSVAEAEAKGINTNTLTPLQKQVKAAPTIAKIKTIVKDQGFVVLDAGSKQGLKPGQELQVRRDNGVLGKLKVTSSLEENEAVADLDLASIPPGISIEPGDEIIQPIAR
jgi:hypothetical protein